MIREYPPLVDAWYLTGATASGKTAVSLALAEKLEAEIISMDSMAVYQGMDVGTAKPSAEERQQVPHHLIDVVAPDQEYSLAEYLSAAHRAAQEIKKRQRRVLFVGGTPLYLMSLLRGACEGPPADSAFRQQVEDEVQQTGMQALYDRLRQVDPLSAAKLHPNDKRRIIRALEVYTLTGQPISHMQTQFEGKYAERCNRVFVISRERSKLHERIHRRTAQLFETGLIEETRQLIDQYASLSKTSLQGVGYQEAIRFLRGETSREEAMEQTRIRTRRYARRQETWFRRMQECQWVSVSDEQSTQDIVQAMGALSGRPW